MFRTPLPADRPTDSPRLEGGTTRREAPAFWSSASTTYGEARSRPGPRGEPLPPGGPAAMYYARGRAEAPGGSFVKRIMVATDRSESAGRAVDWAADMAQRFGAQLLLLQVLVPEHTPGTEAGAAEATRASYAAQDLAKVAGTLAGPRGEAKVVV